MISFRAGAVIRDIQTGHPYIVIQHFKSGVMVCDLEIEGLMTVPAIILESHYDKFEEDFNMDVKKNGDTIEWKHLILSKLPLPSKQ